MDNVTHSLVGVALARAGLNRLTPHACLLMVLSANLPDIDIVTLAAGRLSYFENHRGYTHTFLALPLMSLAAVLLTWLLTRRRSALGPAWFAASIGVASHLLMDWTNSYGVRPLLPFSSRWFYLDLNALYDVVIMAALVAALLLPWFVVLVAKEIGDQGVRRGQGSAILTLLFILAFDGFRWTLHQRALNQLASRLYDGEVPLSVAALPQPQNPFEWKGVVDTPEAFRIVPTNVLLGIDTMDARIYSKWPTGCKGCKAMASTEAFLFMLYFSRFAVWSVQPEDLSTGGGIGERIELTDLRFGVPGAGSFHAMGVVDGAGNILSSVFTF